MSGWLRALPAPLRERIERSPTLRRLVPNTGWMMVDRLVRMAVSLVVSVWVARYLGPEAFGRYNFAIAFAVLFSPLGTLGLERIAVRELVRDREDAHAILGSAFALRLAGGAVGALLAMAGIALLRPGDAEMRTLVAIMSGVMVVQAFDVVDYWNQSRLEARVSVIAMSAGFLVAAAVRLALIFTGAPLVAFAWAWSAELAIGSLGLALSYRLRHGALAAWRLRRERVGTLLRDGWPLVLSGLMVMIYTRVDQVMLGQMAAAKELGNYAAAVKLVEVWYFVPGAIVASAFPSIVEARRDDEALFYERLQRLYNLMAAFSYAVAIPATLLGPWLVRALYGAEYAAAGPMLVVLVWSLVFTSLGVARGATTKRCSTNGCSGSTT